MVVEEVVVVVMVVDAYHFRISAGAIFPLCTLGNLNYSWLFSPTTDVLRGAVLVQLLQRLDDSTHQLGGGWKK